MRLPPIPSLSFLPFFPFLSSSRRWKRGDVRGGWGGKEEGVTRWGLFLMRGVTPFFIPKSVF